ncbi:MAG: N-acyl homoserine lactonase family protein, partial [Chloroflexota bacterium]|nr:N-acyl homoserine lactonase family protein [Chloroflexota bacterium]
AYWTGPYAGRGGHDQDPRDFTHLVEINLRGRIRWVNGDAEVAPGITVHLVGGHTAGMQVVRVATAKGQVVLASDASHYYENIERDRPFRAVHTVPLAYAAFDRVNELAGHPELIVAGHDPLVMARFPAASAELHGLVVRIA